MKGKKKKRGKEIRRERKTRWERKGKEIGKERKRKEKRKRKGKKNEKLKGTSDEFQRNLCLKSYGLDSQQFLLDPCLIIRYSKIKKRKKR